jgi:hypothetical protein
MEKSKPRKDTARKPHGGAKRASPKAKALPSTSRKSAGKRARAVAEASGLGRDDAVVTAHPGAAQGAGPRQPEAASLIDRNVQLWLAMVQLSPLSLALRQQAARAGMLLRLMRVNRPDR